MVLDFEKAFLNGPMQRRVCVALPPEDARAQGGKMVGLLRKNYGARIDGFRGIQRQDIQLEVDVKDSKIALKPQTGWSKTVWEPRRMRCIQPYCMP